VGHSSRKAAQGFEFPRLLKLCFQAFPLGLGALVFRDIHHGADEARYVSKGIPLGDDFAGLFSRTGEGEVFSARNLKALRNAGGADMNSTVAAGSAGVVTAGGATAGADTLALGLERSLDSRI
jgi:hypothetical protein